MRNNLLGCKLSYLIPESLHCNDCPSVNVCVGHSCLSLCPFQEIHPCSLSRKSLTPVIHSCSFLSPVCGIIGSICLVFVPGSWHRAPKSLGIPWVIGASFVLNRQLLVGIWITSAWRLVTRRTKPWLESWNFRPHPQPLGGGEGQEIELIIYHAYRMKPPLKPSKWQGLGSFQVDEHRCWEGDSPGEGMEACAHVHIHTAHFFHLALPLYPLS